MNLPTLLGTVCFRPACIAGGLVLAVLSSAGAEDPTEERMWENFEVRRKASYETRGREALKNRRVINQYGSADYVSIFPVNDLPKELKAKEGEVSLVPDPEDRGGGKIAVYLLNATDQSLPRAVAFRLDCFLEVKDGDRWRACESYIPGCGTGMFEPRPLAAGHGLVFEATDPGIGDMTGELRYCVAISGSRPITSQPFKGRFNSEQFEGANPEGGMAGRGIQRGLDGGGWRNLKEGDHGSLGRIPEEWLAVAELDRCYDESLLSRSMLIRWQASTSASPVMGKCRTAAGRLLERPWKRLPDEASLFHRCFAAITASRDTALEWGSPERCRPVVWRYLNEFRYTGFYPYINPERWEQLELIRKSGNPWGVDQKLVATLVYEAAASLGSPDPAEREAAGTFLQANWIPAKHIPDDLWWFVLQQDVLSARLAAIGALKRRGKAEEAGKWLAEHLDLPGLKLQWLWSGLVDHQSDFAAWEIPIAVRLLETSPLQAAYVLFPRCHQRRDPGRKPLPDELKEPLRKFLSEEATAHRVIGLPPPKMENDASRYDDPRCYDSQHLREALLVLEAWNDPADTPLFRKYLEHPIASYSFSKGEIDREYPARLVAAGILKKRQEEVPKDVVFKERVPSE